MLCAVDAVPTESQIPAQCAPRECCSIPEEALRSCNLYSTRCRDDSTVSTDLKTMFNSCAECAVGECRVSQRCVCTYHFLMTADLRVSCRESHGMVWPNSIGLNDITRVNCGKKATTKNKEQLQIMKVQKRLSSPLQEKINFGDPRANSSSSEKNSSEKHSSEKHSSEKHSFEKHSSGKNFSEKNSSSKNSSQMNSSQKSSSEKNSSKELSMEKTRREESSVNKLGLEKSTENEKKLNGAEIAGIFFGAVGALAAVVGVFVAAFKRTETVEVVNRYLRK